MSTFPGTNGITASSRIGRSAYAFLFVVLLPVSLVLWAWATQSVVRLPAIQSTLLGTVVAAGGLLLVLLGMSSIITQGGGLPMNICPPPRYVTQSVYRFLSHPIYLGFSLICVGGSLVTASASGLWLVTPMVVAGAAALVLGYEQHDLKRRFGEQVRRPLIAIPLDDETAPTLWARLSVYLLVFLPWAILYEAVVLIGAPSDAIDARLPFEKHWPVYAWTEVIYASTYAVVAMVPLAAATCRDLRRFAVSGLLAAGIGGLLWLTIPVIAPPRPFEPSGMLGRLLLWEQNLQHHSGAAALPSFHVIWALLAAAVFARRTPSLRHAWWLWAGLISVSCVTTGQHALLDVVAAFAVFAVTHHSERVWQWMRQVSERIAGSWREWRIGPVRIINHGIYGGMAGFIGMATTGLLIGMSHLRDILIVAVSLLITAALWAQIIEGSATLKRPLGYYGSVIGGLLGGVIVWLLGGQVWLILAAQSVAAPWVQAVGRLRCLVQGCCHGRPCPESAGIRYRHPRSRVVRLASLENVPVYPTQLYSILWNIVCGLVLLRLWFVHVPPPFVTGLYLILAGLGRFVEESFRGEPQTPTPGGLPIYQWNAVVSVLLGAVFTCIPVRATIVDAAFDWRVVPIAVLFGLLTGFVTGVDFPESNRPFSRLT